nr:reverse transcriptase domain-containing protein [Tanacetum cinerariifolium]
MPRDCLKIIESKSKVRQSRAKAVVAKVGTSSSTPAVSSEVAELKDLVRALLLDKRNESSAPVSSSTPALVKAVEPNYVTCGGPTNSTSSKVVKQGIEVTKDQVKTPSSQRVAPVQPLVSQSKTPTLISKPVVAPVSAPMPNVKSSIPYPSRRDNERRCDQANEQIEKIYEIFKDMSFEVSFTDALILMPKFASTLKALIGNKEKLSEMARTPMNEHCSTEALSLPELTPTCMTLELADRSVSKKIGIAKDVSFKVGVFHFPADFVVVDFEPDPRVALILKRCFLKTGRALIDVHKDIYPEFCTHKILMEEDYKPAMQNQRRVNPKIHDVIKKEVEKLLDAGLIYPISDSPWVSPVHCAPKKGGFTIVENEENELIPTRLVTRWRVCIDYRKLNEATHKDHFPLLFMDQMLERLAGNEFYCFLDGFSRYFQIPIDPHDQEKTTFTYPYGTFAYRRMPFGLCNAPGTFQRCMLAIFHDMVEKTMEVFMDDFSIFGNSYENCLSRLDKMLQRCEDTNLSLNWEKSQLMVKEGIVLGHKISKNGIEVDRAKVNVIGKLPHPTTVKGVRSFLGHAGFYQRFIKDFSKISRPMTHLLEKNTPFIFLEDCIKAFQTLKKKLTEAPILIATNWDLPFELMCDASDFAIVNIIKKEVKKLLDAGLIYPISDSPWVSPVHCVPKKGGFTVVENEENELIPTHLVTEWRTMEVFMDDFSVFGNSFENCLSSLYKMLQRCEDTNLCLNWEKSHFMVKEGIVLSHKISKNRIKVDRAKVDVIAKLPHPTTVKDCIKAFQTLKKKLTEAPILIASNWDLPFKLMCDASDFAIGAVLGQRHEKHFRPIHYASKTMTDAESNYTTTEKEMLAVVYAFEKFRSYLIMNKSIVHTDHSTLRYLFAKKMPRRDCSGGFYYSKNLISKFLTQKERRT